MEKVLGSVVSCNTVIQLQLYSYNTVVSMGQKTIYTLCQQQVISYLRLLNYAALCTSLCWLMS